MYQFTEIFKEMEMPKVRTYRMYGLSAGLLLGWLPAWGVSHWLGKGTWFFASAWLASTILGFGIGRCIHKK